METTRFAVFAAVATALLWAAKAVAIATAGGLGKSPFEGPLFFAGMICCLTAAASIGLAFCIGRSRPMRACAALGGVVCALALALCAGLVVSAVQPAHHGWVWGELNLWFVAAWLVVGAFVALRPGGRGSRRVVRPQVSTGPGPVRK